MEEQSNLTLIAKPNDPTSMNFYLVNFSTHFQSQSDRQNVMPKSPTCIGTGGLKRKPRMNCYGICLRCREQFLTYLAVSKRYPATFPTQTLHPREYSIGSSSFIHSRLKIQRIIGSPEIFATGCKHHSVSLKLTSINNQSNIKK